MSIVVDVYPLAKIRILKQITTILVETRKANASSWNTWTYVFAAVDGAARITYSQIGNPKVKEILKGVHTALVAVNKEFIKVIDAINKGEDIPAVTVPPADIDDWGDSQLTGGIIEVVKNALSLLIEELSKITQSDIMQKILHALNGLITAFEDYQKEVACTEDIIVSCL